MSMRKIVAATLVVGVALASTAVRAEDFVVGLSWNAMDNQLPVKWQEYLLSEAKAQGEAAGINFKWVINVADADPARQAANIEDLINQGVNLIIARAEDDAAIGASIRAADQAGIPFITFDRPSSTAKPTAHVGGDSYDQGKTTAEAFVELLKANGVKGECIELQGSLTDVNAMNRSKAWHEVTDASGVVKTLVSVPTEWNPELFRSGTVNALRANPQANCMFLGSDFALPAVQSALEGAGKWAPRGEANHVWIATQDVFPEAVAAIQSKYIDLGTTYDAYAHSKEAIRVAIRVAKGEGVDCPDNICLAKGRLATQENIGTLENLWSRAE
ncbi:sugar ABC transporter substrate-binding protein [Shinella oryzae]|uniref:sugar ABC transporter substrate-binding protein n=1 Tax=Shinella oryzae TaxID=2871820 RepID=UPI001FF17ABB|nr:sugar ABC transporter substrate-binding protein [Shinella oryzae]